MDQLPKEIRGIIYRYVCVSNKQLLHNELLIATAYIQNHFDHDDTYCCEPILWVTTSTFPYTYTMRQCRIIHEVNSYQNRWHIQFKITDRNIDWWRPHHNVEFTTPRSLRNK